MALWVVVRVPAVAVKVPDVALGATLTEAGTVSAGLLSVSAMVLPPAGAA